MLCPNCESENRDGAKFCDECGFPLTGAIARAAEMLAPEGDEAAPETEIPNADGDLSGQLAPELAENDSPASLEKPTNPQDGEDARDERAAPDVTAALDADLAGLDQPSDDYGERVVDAGYVRPQANWRDGQTMQMPRVDADEPSKGTDFLASSATKQRNGKKVAAIIIAAIVAVAAIAALATYQMQLWGGKAVPDVVGMTEADAAGVLEEQGFAVRSTQVKSDDTEGLVLIMDPAAGSRAGEGSEIVIHIATARSIPDIVGKAEERAVAAMEDAGYENVTYEKERSDEAEGTVLSVEPAAGTRAKSSVAITVKVAEPYVVPDTSSLSLDGAIEAIQDEGLSYDIAYIDTEDYPDGAVIGTEPAAEEKVKSDTVVVIEVARARGARLVQLTRDMLSPGSTVAIDGVSYEVVSLGAVEYLGDDTVAFTITAQPFTYFMGQYVSLESREVSGQVAWTADNGVAGITS